MVIYKCEKCHDEFPSKARYDAHMNRKTDCTLNIEYRKPIIIEKFECPHCKKKLKRKLKSFVAQLENFKT